MLAIPPNRQFRTNVKSPRFTRLLMLSVRTVAALVVFVAVSPRSWSESQPTGSSSDAAEVAAKQNSPDAQKPTQNAVRFVGAEQLPTVKKTTTPPQPAPEAKKPAAAAPLSVADYKNYFKDLLDFPRTIAVPAPAPSPPQNAPQAPAPAPPQAAVPVAPAESTARVISRPVSAEAPEQNSSSDEEVVVAKPQPERQVASPDRLPPSDEYRTESRSVVVPPPVSEAHPVTAPAQAPATVPTPVSAPEPQVALLEQVPAKPAPMPAPEQPTTENAPAHTESIPLAASDGQLVPLTTSNYLPANPESYCFRYGVKCPPCGCNPGGPGWAASRPIPWEVFAQGEYIGPARLAHVPVYRLRVDDQLAFVYRLSGAVSGQPYRLNVRDHLQVQSLSAPEVVNREVIIEPDGTITLPLLGQIRAAGATLDELRGLLDEQYKRQIKDPRITVTPLEMNSNLQELRSSVDRRAGQGGQVSDARISPDGTVQLPAIGSVPAQGLTLDELEREVKARYGQIVEGLEVTPLLTARAPRYIFVVGEVRTPGRYTLEGPTSLMSAVAMAGSWNVGAGLNQVVVFRRDENWHLMATTVNIRESLLFKKPCPSGEIWLRDSDIVLVPKSPILCADDAINLIFTRGIYGVFPMSATLNFAKLSTL